MPKGIILVAVEGEIVVGTVRLDFQKQKIFGMFVDPSFQGKGVGKKLLVAIEKRARQNGFKQVGLSSTIPAVRFYEKNGFQCINKNQVFGSITVSGPVVEMKKTLFSTKN